MIGHSHLKFEACVVVAVQVRQHPENAPAWRLLGTVHAENDDDRQASDVSFPA